MSENAENFVEDPVSVTLGADTALSTELLLLKLDQFEGPLDVLLQLARDQKIDLTHISILQLARQYLAFIDRAQQLSLDVAAEYLVMAAWLAYLKSRLLLPREEKNDDEPSAEMMAEALSFQLLRLEAFQAVAKKMKGKMYHQLTVYGRGEREKFTVSTPDKYTVDLYQLLKAYGDITQRQTSSHYKPLTFPVMSMEDAMARMVKMLGRLPRAGVASVWTTLTSFVPDRVTDPLFARSSIASLLTSALELAKQGKVEIRQDDTFRPIYLRAVDREPSSEDVDQNKSEEINVKAVDNE
ncbi:MAG: segregation/condensation protein A [Alphaproteobacteria bacterium]|nr:segregation/condensation protein A [Alphaproteobacteria bacterium]